MEQFEEYNDFEKSAKNSDGFVLQENFDYFSILMANKDGSFSWVANYFYDANNYDRILKEAILGITELNNRFSFTNPDWRQFKPSWLVCANFTFIGDYRNEYTTEISEYQKDLLTVTLGRFKSEQEAYLFLEKFHTNGIYTQSISEIIGRKNELLAEGIDVTPLQDEETYSAIKNKDLDILIIAHKHIYALCSYSYRPILDVAGNVVTTNIRYKPHDITLTADYGIMPDDTLILAYANPDTQALTDEIDKLRKENVAYFKVLRTNEFLPLQADKLIQEDYAIFYGDKDNIQNGLSKLNEDDLTAINDTFPELTGYYGNSQNGGLYVTDLDGALDNKNFNRVFSSMLNRRLVQPYIDQYEEKIKWAIAEMNKISYSGDSWDYIENEGGGFMPEEVAGYYLGAYGELAYQTYFKNSANVQAEPYTEDPYRQKVLDILFNAIGTQ